MERLGKEGTGYVEDESGEALVSGLGYRVRLEAGPRKWEKYSEDKISRTW